MRKSLLKTKRHIYDTYKIVHARCRPNTHVQHKMQAMFGTGYDSGEIEKGLDDSLISQEYKYTGGNYKVIFDELIKPRLKSGINLFEIGPGKGSWVKAVLSHLPNDGTLYAIDRLPLEEIIRQTCPGAQILVRGGLA